MRQKCVNRNIQLSGPSGNCPKTFHTVWKFSSLSGNFQDRLESFQTVRKLFRQSGNFPDRPETFQTVQKLSIQSGNFLTHSINQASFNGQFCIYAQKLSGRAKTFRSAMQTRRRGFSDSAWTVIFLFNFWTCWHNFASALGEPSEFYSAQLGIFFQNIIGIEWRIIVAASTSKMKTTILFNRCI